MKNNARPNILIFMTDHQRGDTVPPFDKAITPNLDKFYQNAVAFKNTYCTAPHCCPARASFFSGLYPSRHGVWNNVSGGNALSRGLNDGVKLWSEDLKEAGYRLYYTGKWHVSAEESPAEKGWEMIDSGGRYEMPKGRRPAPETAEWSTYERGGVCKGDESREEAHIIREGYPLYTQYGDAQFGQKKTASGDRKKVESAVESILERDDTDSPWCHYIGVNGPHDPYFVPREFIEMYTLEDIQLPKSYYDNMKDKPAIYRRVRERFDQLSDMEHRKSIRHYLAFCTYEDYLFGKLLEALERKGELDNTVVIYTSDHGDYMGEHGLWTKGLPCFRGAYHVPLLIKWPGVIKDPGRSVEHFVSHTDIAPTILDIANVKADREFAGMSLLPFLKGEEPENWRDAVFTQTNGNELYGIQRSVMTKEWKYVYNGFDYDELYNLREDPEEMHNLAGSQKHKEVVRNLSKRMWEFAHKHGDVCINSYIMTAVATYGPGIAFQAEASDDKS